MQQPIFLLGVLLALLVGLAAGKAWERYKLIEGRWIDRRRVRQAPRWMQRCGLEWFFRLCTEPRRLGPRYLKTNPLFVLRIAAQKTGLKKYPMT